MQGTWVWTNSRRWWRTGKPGMLQSMGSQRVRHNWASKQQQRELQISEWPGLDYLLILESKVESIPSKLLAWEIEKCTCLKRLLCVCVCVCVCVFSKKGRKPSGKVKTILDYHWNSYKVLSNLQLKKKKNSTWQNQKSGNFCFRQQRITNSIE